MAEWRMEARDVEGEPIIGPWETEEEARRRSRETVDNWFIVSAEAVPKK